MTRNSETLICPHCKDTAGSYVTDSRAITDAIRRRRECSSCKSRYTTYERVVPIMPGNVNAVDPQFAFIEDLQKLRDDLQRTLAAVSAMLLE